MLSVLPLGDMIRLKVMAVFVCMSLCQPKSVSRYDRWRLPWVNIGPSDVSSPFIAVYLFIISKYELAPTQLYSSMCFFRFDFDEEMFFDKVALGVAFDVCFQYASCGSEVVICYPPTRQ